MVKYSKKILDKIYEFICSDTYTIAEICKMTGISERTFYEWKSKRPDFAELINKAEMIRDEHLVKEAKKSLLKRIRGYTIEETRTTYKNDPDKNDLEIKEQVVTTKHVLPDTAAIKFTLMNRDSKNWINSRSVSNNDQDYDNEDDSDGAIMKLPDGTEIEV